MKTILRRKSHGAYKYRTTDADGEQILWMTKPTFYTYPADFFQGGRWASARRTIWSHIGYAPPTTRPAKALVRIVTAKRGAK